ncbi:MAG: DUF4136 domain-containing protein [Chromatiales bacterium]|nr:DUF4136 domain-containing protein [Chromatiales bacterium]
MYSKILILTLATALLAACATGPRVETIQAPGADLSAYQSFAFVEPLGTDRAGYASLISQQLKFSTRRELELRGLNYVDDPSEADLLVNFQAHLDERIRTRSVPEPYMGPTFYDYRYGYYSPWPTYTTRTEIEQYSEGTLVVDLIDAARNEMVWEGVARNSVNDKTRRNAARLIDEAVARMFAKFP